METMVGITAFATGVNAFEVVKQSNLVFTSWDLAWLAFATNIEKMGDWGIIFAMILKKNKITTNGTIRDVVLMVSLNLLNFFEYRIVFVKFQQS